MSWVQIAVLGLALVILAANTLLAIAFLRSHRGRSGAAPGRNDAALDELHRRVQELPTKRG